MIERELVGPGVYFAKAPIVNASMEELRFLLDEVVDEPRGRVRLCSHRDTGDKLQEMFIAFTGGNYVRPSFHRKDESLHILQGEATYLFFDGEGRVVDAVALGGPGSGRAIYCRIPADTYHSLVIESKLLLVHEITSGPFLGSDTEFAPWAPEDHQTGEVAVYQHQLWDAMTSWPSGAST